MAQITEHNAITGETIVREMSTTEFQQYEADQNAIKELIQAETDRAKLKAETLTKLGLTADEVAALFS